MNGAMIARSETKEMTEPTILNYERHRTRDRFSGASWFAPQRFALRKFSGQRHADAAAIENLFRINGSFQFRPDPSRLIPRRTRNALLLLPCPTVDHRRGAYFSFSCPAVSRRPSPRAYR